MRNVPEEAHVVFDRNDMKGLAEIAMASLMVQPTSYKDIYDTPSNFNEAWGHQDNWQKSRWRAAIGNELEKMKEYKVWETLPRS